MHKPTYGVSYNCQYGPEGGMPVGGIGGGCEGDTTLDFIGDSLEEVCEAATDLGYTHTAKLPDFLVGMHTNLGGEIVAVIGENLGSDDEYILAVVFKDPDTLIV